MINWSVPTIDLITDIAGLYGNERCPGSDTAPANLFLLGGKYDIRLAVSDNAVLRYYNGSKPNRVGYGFPLCRPGADIGKLVGLLRDDAAVRGVPFGFCLCDERQKAAIDAVCRVDWKCTDDDSDYIYKRESLAGLSGKKLHRKRNHINNFKRMYDDAEYRELTPENRADALKAAEMWLGEREEITDDQRSEFESIRKALDNMEALHIFGGVLYVAGTPVAMTAASALSPSMTDVHYEKAYGEYADNGAFTVINREFAAAADCEYINREEDMGIEGLRTAKESYYPAFKLKKYYGVCKC